MNTIPSIFNERVISYTVTGGLQPPANIAMSVTCVVLSRGGRHLRARVIENLLDKGFEKIISVNPVSERDSVEGFAAQFPQVSFLLALEEASQGELLNLAFAEAKSDHVLVVQEQMCFDTVAFDAQLASRLSSRGHFCVAPTLLSQSHVPLPVALAPSAKRSVFDVERTAGTADNQRTLYAVDWAGFYDRQKFVLLGGIDYTISSPYWQKLDFFFRAWLWGETVSLSRELSFSYTDVSPEEDSTVDVSYLRFYLKNLAPAFKVDHAHISWLSWFTFKLHNQCGTLESIRQFKDAMRWTKENQWRFKTDAVSLIENWGAKG